MLTLKNTFLFLSTILLNFIQQNFLGIVVSVRQLNFKKIEISWVQKQQDNRKNM